MCSSELCAIALFATLIVNMAIMPNPLPNSGIFLPFTYLDIAERYNNNLDYGFVFVC